MTEKNGIKKKIPWSEVTTGRGSDGFSDNRMMLTTQTNTAHKNTIMF